MRNGDQLGEATTAHERSSPHARVDAAPARLLLVDDLAANLLALEALLAPLAHELVPVTSGVAALREAARSDFAAILLDVQMPGMDGFETARRLKQIERARATPILFLTAIDTDAPSILRAYEEGAVDFIQKPIEPTIVRSKVAVFIALYEAKETARRHEIALRERERTDLLGREQRAREEAERLAERLLEANRLKDEFLATLSHEIRTPLNAVLGWTRMLRNGAASGAQRSKALEVIERNAQAQLQLIEDMLDVSRITSGKLELKLILVDLMEVVDLAVQTILPAAQARGVRVRAHVEPDTALLMRADADRLRQVVWNLLNNAVKFSPPGSEVSLALASAEGSVELVVDDRGEGIEPSFLPFVFDKFRQADAGTTRAHGGLGLGLAIVKHIVELHGGTIAAASEGKGKGARFTVRLPAGTPPSPAPDEPLAADDRPRLDGMHVLVVDDEEDGRLLLASLLEGCGAVVETAASAAEAMAAFDRFRPDAVVSDIGMPGEDGFALVQRIRLRSVESGGATPAVAVTAYARKEDRRRAVLAGFDTFIQKPVEELELLGVMANIRRRQGRASAPD